MRIVLDYIDGFKERARRYGLGDALVVYGVPLLLFTLAAVAVAEVVIAAIFGK